MTPSNPIGMLANFYFKSSHCCIPSDVLFTGPFSTVIQYVGNLINFNGIRVRRRPQWHMAGAWMLCPDENSRPAIYIARIRSERTRTTIHVIYPRTVILPSIIKVFSKMGKRCRYIIGSFQPNR